MQTRVLGRTGLEVSAVGMGGIPMMRCSHEEGVALHRYAIDQDITYFDAARGYRNCHAPLAEAEMGVIEDQRQMRSPMFCRLCYRHRECPNGVAIDDLMIADLSFTRFGLDMLMRRGWGDSVAATAQCLTCEIADECRASCHHGVDIPRYLSHVYTTYMPVIEDYRRAHPDVEVEARR